MVNMETLIMKAIKGKHFQQISNLNKIITVTGMHHSPGSGGFLTCYDHVKESSGLYDFLGIDNYRLLSKEEFKKLSKEVGFKQKSEPYFK